MFPLKLLRYLLPLLLLTGQTVALAEDATVEADYILGKGWQIPGTGLKLGGYASAGLEQHEPHRWSLGVDDLSLFVHWENEGKLRLFAELDLEDPLVKEQGSSFTTEHTYLALERLYVDYLYSERLNFRAGKFLTPIGRWNVIHAAPLVWTTSRPLITEKTFPTNATGAMVYGTLPAFGQELDYSVYTALGNDWRPDPALDPFEEAYGLHLNLPVSGIGELGFSYANFEQESAADEHRRLLGLDYFWAHGGYEISAEAAYRFSGKDGQDDEKGLFIQGVMPLSPRLHGILRYELFDRAGPAPAMNLWLAGVAYHLSPAMVLKAEYSHASNNELRAPEGWFASWAVLF